MSARGEQRRCGQRKATSSYIRSTTSTYERSDGKCHRAHREARRLDAVGHRSWDGRRQHGVRTQRRQAPRESACQVRVRARLPGELQEAQESQTTQTFHTSLPSRHSTFTMAQKEATVFVLDLGRSMGGTRHGRTKTNLDWALQYFWDKITTTVSSSVALGDHLLTFQQVSTGRKTALMGVIGFRTNGKPSVARQALL
jgi:hypothetical protein